MKEATEKINKNAPIAIAPITGDSCDSKTENLGSISRFVNYIKPEEIADKYTGGGDLDNGRLFADMYCRILRFVPEINRWMYYGGTCWGIDISETFVDGCARDLAYYLNQHDSIGGIGGLAILLSKRSKRRSMIQDARSINPLRMNDFDSDPLLINTLNCTIDLKDGSRREHNPDDLLTKIANVNYDPEAKCERWGKFINEVMCGDGELSTFLQKSLGYALSGDVSLECLLILWGRKTRNGKGTLMETVLKVMGDYARSLSPASLSQKSRSGDTPSPEFASVAGVRLVTVSEPDRGMKLNVALTKRLTGGDPIIARHLHRNPIEYRPQFKIFINTNHLMEIDDETIFSSGRIKMVPFERHFEESERDHGLKDTFKKPENASAIFNWLLKGHQLFKTDGLTPPAKSDEALTTYRKECDTISLFMESLLERCDDSKRTKTSDLYIKYKEWFTKFDIEGKSQKEFVDALRQKGLVTRHRTDGHIVKGYVLKNKSEGDVAEEDKVKTSIVEAVH